jgi:hypothetical protein
MRASRKPNAAPRSCLSKSSQSRWSMEGFLYRKCSHENAHKRPAFRFCRPVATLRKKAVRRDTSAGRETCIERFALIAPEPRHAHRGAQRNRLFCPHAGGTTISVFPIR